jgi:hypothetical protein
MACRRDPNGVSHAKNSPAYGRRTMPTLKMLRQLSMMALVVCTMGIPYAHAADNYRVLKRNTTTLDDGAATHTLSCVLSPNTVTSSSVVSSAVLQFTASGVTWEHNEMYINPPTRVCTDNGSEDANRSASIGVLNAHASDEIFTEQKVFSSARLQPGIACAADNDCLISDACGQAGVCLNRLLVCSRTENGRADQPPNDVDDFSLHNIVLHYKTN